MSKLISEKSNKVSTADLDLFTIPSTSVGIVSSSFVEAPLISNTSGVVEWRYALQKFYLNLSRSYITATIQIRDEKGVAIVVKADEGFPMAFTNAIGKTLFKQLVLSINGVQVESCSNYAYRAFIETELFTEVDHKQHALSMCHYAYDTDPGEPTCEGHLKRQGWVKGGKAVTVAAPLHLNLSQQNRLLLNFLDVKLQAHINNNPFLIDAIEVEADNAKYTVHIERISLILNQVELHDSTASAIEETIRTQSVVYPYTAVEMRSFFLNEGALSTPHNRLFQSHLPRRVIACLVNASAYVGDYKKSAFKFEHLNVREAYLECGGRIIPARGTSLDFANDDYMPAYLNFVEGLGIGKQVRSNGISYDDFKKHPFFVFEVSPYVQEPTFDLIKLGTTSLHLEFAKPVPKGGAFCILYCEFDSTLTFSPDRTPRIDSLM